MEKKKLFTISVLLLLAAGIWIGSFVCHKAFSYKKAVELVKQGHKRLPHYRFLGWDVTIDEAGEPVIIEYNINGPGVLYYQYANGSLFGDYFDVIYNAL